MNQYDPVIQAAEMKCDKAAAFDNAGSSLTALKAFNKILLEFPAYPRALHARGILLFKLGKADEAVDAIKDCLDKNPKYLDALNSLGNIYRSCYSYEDALACYNKILDHDDKNYRAYYCIGQIKQKERDDDAALKYFHKAVKCDKTFVPAYLGIINTYKKLNKLVEAEKICRKALKLEPGNSEAQYLLAAIRAEHGDIPEAISLMEKIKPSDPYGMAAHASKLYYLNLLPEITQEQIYDQSRLFEKQFALQLNSLQSPHVNCPDPERKLRIGFVSGDIKLHPVARHLRPLLQNLDRSRFELYAYNNYNVHDEVTEEFKSLFCYWRNIHEVSDEKSAEMVRLDTIDILFDLSGYTGYSRLMLFARKPAPIQVSWIGYFNTTGFDAMDYIISDDITTPEGQDQWFSEEILRMPQSRFCYDPRADILPDVSGLPVLKRGYIAFGAFCKINKLNDSVVKTWASILAAVPASRLILKWFAYKDRTVIKSVSDRFAKYGIDSSRLEFRQESGYIDLLREYTDDIDISLDTFPHSGGATSCDAFSMGVPVLTLSGKIPISRQTHGFLKTMGLENELVAYSESEYIDLAVKLATDLPRLEKLRSILRERFLGSPVCDGVTFTRDFELAMRAVWRRWCHGKTIEGVLSCELLNTSEIYNEGINLMGVHSYNQAAVYFAKVLETDKKNDKAMNNLAICLWEQGELEEAEKVLRLARKTNRKNDDVCCNLSGLLISKNKQAALVYSRKGLEINAENLDLYSNHIVALLELSKLTEALETMNIVINKFPISSKIMAQSANCYGAMGNTEQADACLRKSLELDISNANAHSNLLYVMNNSDKYLQRQMFEEATNWDRLHSVRPDSWVIQPAPVRKEAKLRIGLVSADFRQHPGGMLLYPFIEHYDRNCLEVFCYFNHHKYDQMTSAIRSKSNSWREVAHLSDQQLYDLVRNDQIDILIDMNGHTDKHRLKFFSMKPCRVQATWLGFFNTTGVSAIDYFISDEFTTPDWMQQWFSEKIVRMPYSRFCYAAPEYSPLVSLAPSEWKGFITFGAFNNCAKLSDTTLNMWAQVLKEVPKSRLMLKWRSYRDKNVKSWIYDRFERLGISKNRIMIRQDINHSQMLADYSDVDIVLDTFPFNGGMTSIEALWMGVPIVTMAGETPASRQSGSFLGLVGLEDCIASDLEGYVRAAVQLSSNRDRLYDIRGTLRQRMKKSPLMDGELFANNMQCLLEHMYQDKK